MGTGIRIVMATRCEVPSILCGYHYTESGSLGSVLLVCKASVHASLGWRILMKTYISSQEQH